MKLFSNTAKVVGLSTALAISSLAMGGGNPDGTASVTVTSASGLPGSEVEVQVVFGHTGATQALTVDMEFDPTFFSNVNLDDCVELISPTQNAAACFVRNAPNDNQIRINLLNVPTPANVADGPFGTMRFTIDPGATEGDSTMISIIDVVLEGSPELNLTNSTIDVISGPPAVLDVDPGTIDFMGVRIGETSPENPIAICNDANPEADPPAANLTVSSIGVSPAQFAEGAGSTCGATSFDLAPGECCNYHVTFSPDAPDGFNGSVSIESSVGDETVSLSGQGTVTDASLTIDPAAWDFGSVDIEAAAVCQDFTVSNTPGDDSLTIETASLGVVMMGNGVSPFAITANSCNGATLSGGQSCMVTVCFNPDAEGNFAATLTVTSDVNDVNADLEGEGTAEANIAVSPPFGPVNLGSANAGTTLSANGSVSNSGSAPADVSCMLTPGPDSAGVFSTEPSLVGPITVDPGANVGFQLFCALPDGAEDGAEFTATLRCDVDGAFAGDHDLSCSVRAFQPIPINTLQPMGLALFALLMLLIGGISIRLFRAS